VSPVTIDPWLTMIAMVKSTWRMRDITVYEHPYDPLMVVSIGVPFGGGEPIPCLDMRVDWQREIDHYARHKTVVVLE
jgi:hypothetical protein